MKNVFSHYEPYSKKYFLNYFHHPVLNKHYLVSANFMFIGFLSGKKSHLKPTIENLKMDLNLFPRKNIRSN